MKAEIEGAIEDLGRARADALVAGRALARATQDVRRAKEKITKAWAKATKGERIALVEAVNAALQDPRKGRPRKRPAPTPSKDGAR